MKILARLLLTALGQIVIIVVWSAMPGQEVVNYLLFFLPASIPFAAILNYFLKSFILILIEKLDNYWLKILVPFGVILLIAGLVCLLALFEINSLVLVATITLIFSLPLLAIEMIAYIFMNNEELKEASK